MPVTCVGQQVFATPVYPITSAGETFQLPVFTAPCDLTIRRIESTIGTDGAPAGQPFPAVDVHLAVYVSRPAGYLAFFHWIDKYSPDVQPHKDKVFGECDAIPLQAGDQLSVGLYAQTLFGAVSHVQAIVIVSYDAEGA